ncbi:hypothetical protein VMUT_1809 [Vulcanisaeta moutnovskia 768-28]|uniref:Uncharacterized protein n=1 Tax=Vulcanisaeta moutnovskia (strain 768-28) TaxID=985053 RepID=F0QVA8_VULM7|nr:hypothetical protein [Vulcanisaeta moutnovskia]ADY02010.1 hypothetical protein VMUT_1809 [Vulcanisaeta moutnovskia 768-28]
MSTNIDININVDELHRRILENKRKVTDYVKRLSDIYDKINNETDLPDRSEKVIIDIPNSIPIIIYKEPSKEAYRELFSKALQFLKLEYAIYETLEGRLGKLKGHEFKAIVRYFGDVPSLVVIELDSTKK